MTQGVKTVRGVMRALDILDQFLDRPGPLGAAEAARLTGMPRSTAYRMILSLQSRGYLQRAGDGDERFTLGERLLAVGRRRQEPGLLALAQPVMDGLRETCGETVALHLLEGDRRVCVAAAEGSRSLHTSGRVGSGAPLYSGASSRAIMAFLPAEQQEEIIARTGLAALTPNTITNPDSLRSELARIRSEGLAVSTGEWSEGITSVAAPIFAGSGVVGSINISGPAFRFGADKLTLLGALVKAAAAEISRRLKGGSA